MSYAVKPRVHKVTAIHDKSRYDIARGIKSAPDRFETDTGSYPKGSNGLVEWVQQSGGTTNRHGPYFDPPELPIDPWGNVYIYGYPGKRNPSSYDLMSIGPDGKAGTEDDICN